MFWGMDDVLMRKRMIDEGNAPEATLKREHARLRALIRFAEGDTCRKQVLLAHFGETSAPCGTCDVCAPRTSAAAPAARRRTANGRRPRTLAHVCSTYRHPPPAPPKIAPVSFALAPVFRPIPLP
jgi:ATP-dependent DNA helicase RecQ